MAAQDRGPELAAVAIAFMVSAVVTVGLRCYTMGVILKRFYIEDCLAVVAMLTHCALCIFTILGVQNGLGQHLADVTDPDERVRALVWKWAGSLAYIAASTLVKFVVGGFLLRLCGAPGPGMPRRWQFWVLVLLLGMVGLYNAFYFVLAVLQCRPVEFFWYRYTPVADMPAYLQKAASRECNGHTLATVPTYGAIVLAVVSDWTLALLPISLVKGAGLDRRTKVSVVVILAMGSMASLATIARIPYAKQLLSNPDYLYNSTDLDIWSIVECGLAITASSLAMLRPLFVKLRLFARTNITSRLGSNQLRSHNINHASCQNINHASCNNKNDNNKNDVNINIAARNVNNNNNNSGSSKNGAGPDQEYSKRVSDGGKSVRTYSGGASALQPVRKAAWTPSQLSRSGTAYGDEEMGEPLTQAQAHAASVADVEKGFALPPPPSSSASSAAATAVTAATYMPFDHGAFEMAIMTRLEARIVEDEAARGMMATRRASAGGTSRASSSYGGGGHGRPGSMSSSSFRGRLLAETSWSGGGVGVGVRRASGGSGVGGGGGGGGSAAWAATPGDEGESVSLDGGGRDSYISLDGGDNVPERGSFLGGLAPPRYARSPRL